jgi:hypothetical protein
MYQSTILVSTVAIVAIAWNEQGTAIDTEENALGLV